LGAGAGGGAGASYVGCFFAAQYAPEYPSFFSQTSSPQQDGDELWLHPHVLPRGLHFSCSSPLGAGGGAGAGSCSYSLGAGAGGGAGLCTGGAVSGLGLLPPQKRPQSECDGVGCSPLQHGL
jgi:hypothetical protein